MAQSCCRTQGRSPGAADNKASSGSISMKVTLGRSLISGVWSSWWSSGCAQEQHWSCPDQGWSLFYVSRHWGLTKRCPSDANQ